ncbi:MAG: glycosyltransferase [Planctomycetes bacterium]|nr:glycosyltransferase [Planctomycetota bacterium]
MSDADSPVVTVVTPAFNAEDCIQRCIDSVKSQDLPGIEHVVVDGGSRDSTIDIVRRAGLRHVSERDAGIYDAMSKGVRMARGEFVHILNADDYFAGPRSVRTLVEAMRARSLDVAHGRVRQVRADGSTVRTFGRDASHAQLLRKMVVAHPSTMVRRWVYDRHGAFSVGFRIAADHEWVLRVWPKLAVGFVPEVLVEMRIGGVSTASANVVRAYRESTAAAIMHGAGPLRATFNCWYEIAKHLAFFRRTFVDTSLTKQVAAPAAQPS